MHLTFFGDISDYPISYKQFCQFFSHSLQRWSESKILESDSTPTPNNIWLLLLFWQKSWTPTPVWLLFS